MRDAACIARLPRATFGPQGKPPPNMAIRVRTWKRRTAERLSALLDRAERLGGRRFYELHLEAAALRHRRGANVVELAAGAHRIKFRTPSAKSLWRANTLLDKEPATIRWIDTFQAGDVLWDIGANIGIYSLYAGVVKRSEVLAFEPAAFNHALLCDNIRLNGLQDRVAAYGLAFSDRSELGRLTVADDEPGAAVVSVGDAPVGRLHQAALVYTIDDFIARFAPPFPTHIKIDVDGLETEILEGSRRTLADPRLKSLLFEVDERDGARPEQIDAVLGEFGFRLVEVQGSPLAPNSASRNRIYRRSGP
jgi:FkbM family methyltransferase